MRRGPRRRMHRPRRGPAPSAGARRTHPARHRRRLDSPRGLRGVRDTDADEHGQIGDRLEPPGERGGGGGERGPLPRHAEQTDRVDEPARRVTIRGSRSAGAVGAASMTVSTPASSAAAHHGSRFLERQIGQDATGDTGRDETAGEAPVAVVVDEVVVRHDGQRDAYLEIGAGIEDRRRVSRPLERACDACWMTGPSITGSENGTPISIAVSPAADAARTASPTRVAARDVRHEELAPAVSRRAEVLLHPRRHPVHRGSIAWSTSLSPRPDRFTSTVWPARPRRLRATHARACADSRAARIPSVRARTRTRRDLVVGGRRVLGPPDRAR